MRAAATESKAPESAEMLLVATSVAEGNVVSTASADTLLAAVKTTLG